MRHLGDARMGEDVDRDQQQAARAERHRDPLESPEAAGERGADHHGGGQGDRRDLRQAQVTGGQGDPDELGDECQRVEQEQVDDAEGAPEPAEPLQDEPGVPDPGHSAEAQHHLLVHVKDRHQQQQRPQQPGAVVLPGLPVGGERTGVVVAGHDDQPGADDRQQRLKVTPPAAPGRGVIGPDGAERAADVADVLVIEHSAAQRRGRCGHEIPPSPRPGYLKEARVTAAPLARSTESARQLGRWISPAVPVAGCSSGNGADNVRRRAATACRVKTNTAEWGPVDGPVYCYPCLASSGRDTRGCQPCGAQKEAAGESGAHPYSSEL